MTQPKTSTPKLSTKAQLSASLGQSKLNQSEQPNIEASSQSQAQSQINKALFTSLPSSVKSVKFDKQDENDSKRRPENTHLRAAVV